MLTVSSNISTESSKVLLKESQKTKTSALVLNVLFLVFYENILQHIYCIFL